MSGEIGIDIKNIRLSKFSDGFYEMHIADKNGGNLHIVGDNDLKTLLEEALNNIQIHNKY